MGSWIQRDGLIICVAAVLALFFCSAAEVPTEPKLRSNSLTAYQVVKIVDGDTIKVQMGDEVKTVRIIGVDTPETKDPRKPVQRFGQEASDFTTSLLDGEKVYLEPDQGEDLEHDRFERVLAHVWRASDKSLVALTIIKEGYGFYYSKYPFRQDYMNLYRDAERDAREHKRGLWEAEE